jgi:hypothetical protein
VRRIEAAYLDRWSDNSMSLTPSPAPDMTGFIALSSVLTGIAATSLLPSFPTNDVHQQILDAAWADDPDALTELLAAFTAATQRFPNDPAMVLRTLLVSGDSPIALMAKSIILAWYSGAWYATAGLYPAKTRSARVLSAIAYEQGYMWKVAQAHAMGSADYPFGYWNGQPPSLQDYTGQETIQEGQGQ